MLFYFKSLESKGLGSSRGSPLYLLCDLGGKNKSLTIALPIYTIGMAALLP